MPIHCIGIRDDFKKEGIETKVYLDPDLDPSPSRGLPFICGQKFNKINLNFGVDNLMNDKIKNTNENAKPRAVGEAFYEAR